jgi:hypothetical protein
MTWTWHNPDRGPTPAELAAWADGELGPADAGRVEAWLLDHPEAVEDAEVARRLVGLFRDHAVPDPSSVAWQTTLDSIRAGLTAPPVPAGRSPADAMRPALPVSRLRMVLGLVSAAAVLSGILVAGLYWPRPDGGDRDIPVVVLPPGDDNDEPFAVVTASEVNIISMNAIDADRLALGSALLGTFEFAAPRDIEVVKVVPDAEEGNRSRLQCGPQVPMIVLARVDGEDEEP